MLSPKAGVVFYLAIYIGDEVVDTLVANKEGDVVVVDRTRELFSEFCIYLCSRFGAERLVSEIGVGIDGKCTLLRIKSETYKFACTNLNVFSLVGAKILLQALFDCLVLRLRCYAQTGAC